MLIADMLIIPLVLLIGYWWANQGLFSAILHLACVIVAWALAFAFWEPLTLGLLLRGGRFDGFMWGASLVGMFVVALFVLRLATNKLVPANLDLPRWANLSFGFPVGLASGVLTMGITLIGLGMIQSDSSVAGLNGWRRAGGGKVTEVNRLLLPVHKMTAQFYDALSVGAFSTSTPLRHYQPQLDRQAASLIRDSYRDGRGQVAMRPDQVSVVGAYLCPDRVVVSLRFNRGARDYNDQLTLSAAQVRLVAAASGRDQPLVVHPDTWSQEVKDEGEKVFAFDDVTHYATTIPGRESADIRMGFPWREGLRPSFVQIKGARIYIRPQQLEPLASCDEVLRSNVATLAPEQGPVGGGVIQPDSEIRTSTDIRPVQTSTNALPGTISHEDRWLTEGFGFFPRSGASYSRQQQIRGIFEPAGTRIVQLEVGRTSSADVGGRVRADAGDSASPVLVDDRGHTYTAMGYIYEKSDGTDIKLAPGAGLTLKDIPQPPSAGNQALRLVFQVTEGSNLVAFRVGSVNVASCNYNVAAKNR